MLLNDLIKYSTVSSLSLLLIACGGGGGGGSDDPVPQPTTVVPVVEESGDTEEEATGTAGLKVPEGFDFETAYLVDFSVRLSSRTNERVFVAVCTEFSESEGGYQVDYDRCVFKASMTDGNLSETLSVTNDKRELLVSLWFFDGSETAYYSWSRGEENNDVETLTISE